MGWPKSTQIKAKRNDGPSQDKNLAQEEEEEEEEG